MPAVMLSPNDKIRVMASVGGGAGGGGTGIGSGGGTTMGPGPVGGGVLPHALAKTTIQSPARKGRSFIAGYA